MKQVRKGAPRSAYAIVASCVALAACATAPSPQPPREGTQPTANAHEASPVDRVRRISIAGKDVSDAIDGYRIAFVSDIHLGNGRGVAWMESLVRAVNAEGCDCVILGGDYTRDASWIEPFAKAAAGLRSRDGVYAIMGNHDIKNGKGATIRALRASGIAVLEDETAFLPNGIAISGTIGWPEKYRCPPSMTDAVDPRAFAILASHDPDFVENAAAGGMLGRYDLVLSGHTHGGQITVFGWAPYNVSRYGARYLTGETEKNGIPVAVSNGAGYGGLFLHVRAGAPSDYLVVTLRKTPFDEKP